MTTAQRQKLSQLESTLSNEAGFPVEITIRWENEFTLSADGEKVAELKELVAKIGGKLDGDMHGYDEECDMSCVFFVG